MHCSTISFYTATALILKKLGFDVHLLLYPKASHDSTPDDVNQILVENEINKLKIILNKIGIKIELLHKYDQKNVNDKNVIKSVNEQSIADVKTLLMTTTLNLKDHKVKNLYNFRVSENFLFLKKFNNYLNVIEHNDTDNFVIDSGSWAEYGVAYNLLNKFNKNITCTAYRNIKDTIVISKNSPFTELELDQIWEKTKNQKLNLNNKNK